MTWNPPYHKRVACVREPLQIESLLRNHTQGKKNKQKRYLGIYAPTREEAYEYFWRIMDKVAWRDGVCSLYGNRTTQIKTFGQQQVTQLS